MNNNNNNTFIEIMHIITHGLLYMYIIHNNVNNFMSYYLQKYDAQVS